MRRWAKRGGGQEPYLLCTHRTNMPTNTGCVLLRCCVFCCERRPACYKEACRNVRVALVGGVVLFQVDREERPDVDQCFMTFVQATSGGGGWPMSVWLTPELKPFVGATYFPEMRFISILQTLADKWSSDR